MALDDNADLTFVEGAWRVVTQDTLTFPMM